MNVSNPGAGSGPAKAALSRQQSGIAGPIQIGAAQLVGRQRNRGFGTEAR